MADHNNFQVVEFYDDGQISIGIIIESWIFHKNGGVYCYYPPKKDYLKCVKGNIPPKEFWGSYRVRQLRTNIGNVFL